MSRPGEPRAVAAMPLKGAPAGRAPGRPAAPTARSNVTPAGRGVVGPAPHGGMAEVRGSRGGKTDVFLQPGEYFVGNAAHRIRTVLGSCVSVTLWSPLRQVGAMSHFLLATRAGPLKPGGSGGSADARPWDARYGDEALRLMLRELARMKVEPSQCQAKIFGGGDMFPAQKVAGTLAIGRRNGEAARGLLLAEGIEVISESLFGEGHRQIAFDVGTGHVWSRQVPPYPEFGATMPHPLP